MDVKYFKKIFIDSLIFIYYLFFGVKLSAAKSFKNNATQIKENKNFPEFQKYYQENIIQKNLAFEKIRIKNLKNLIARCRLILLFLASIISINIFVNEFYPLEKTGDNILKSASIYLSISSCALFIYIIIKNFDAYNKEIKSILFTDIFKFVNLSYFVNGSENIEQYEKFGIIPYYKKDLSRTDNLIVGSYNNVEFSFEELGLNIYAHKTPTPFRGFAIKLQFNKKFNGRTIIKKDNGKILNFLRDEHTMNLEKVYLEDVEFEEKFETYSSDQIEARHLLTPSSMERLKNLINFFQAKKFEASFYDNSLFMIFETDLNFLKIDSILREFDLASKVEKLLQEISLIRDLIDELKL